MKKGEQWQYETAADEYAIVILGGVCSVRSSRGEWLEIGRRPDVFSGMPYTLYLPRRTRFTVEATSDNLDIACSWCGVDTDYPPRLVTPDQVPVKIRGGENASRQINGMIPPGFNCQRLIAVEVYTRNGRLDELVMARDSDLSGCQCKCHRQFRRSPGCCRWGSG